MAVTYLRQPALLRLLLLCVVVTRQPPCYVVAGHGKLTALLLNEEVVQLALLGKLVAETDTFIVDAEADDDGALVVLLIHAALAFACRYTGSLPLL